MKGLPQVQVQQLMLTCDRILKLPLIHFAFLFFYFVELITPYQLFLTENGYVIELQDQQRNNICFLIVYKKQNKRGISK